jgi:flagellar hook assembly protein FlgD
VATDLATISPNGDGQADTATLAYRLSAAANVSVEIVDASGVVQATVVDRVWAGAGAHTVTLDGSALVDGSYDVRVTARTATGVVVERDTPLTVSSVLGLVSATPAAFSPNGDGRNDTLDVSFALTAPAQVRIRIERDGRWVASPLAATYAAGAHRFTWDGSRVSGRLRDGAYDAVVEVDATTGPISFGAPFVADTLAPRVRIIPGARLKVAVSEPSTLTFVIDGSAVRRVVKKAGTVRIPWPGPARRVRVVAWDAAGNASAPTIRVRRPKEQKASE